MTCAALHAAALSGRITPTQHHVLTLIDAGLTKRADMARIIGMTVVTVARAITALVALEWVEREERKGKPSLLRVNATRILHDTALAGSTRIMEVAPDTHDTGGRSMDDTGGRIPDDTGHSHDTGQKRPRIKNAGARGNTKLLTIEELNPERPESSGESAARAPQLTSGIVTLDIEMTDRMQRLAAEAGVLNGNAEAAFLRWRAHRARKCADVGDFDADFHLWVLDDVKTSQRKLEIGHEQQLTRATRMEIRGGKVSATSAFLLGGQSGDDSAIDLGRLDSQRID